MKIVAHNALISLLIVVNLISGCSYLPEKHIYTEILIQAPAEDIWAVLVNNQAYPQWNPYHIKVEGEIHVGSQLSVHIQKPNGDQVFIQPHVIQLQPSRILTWGGGIPGIFTGEHTFLLEEQNDFSTLLVQEEMFRGIAVPFASLESIESGYNAMNQALKKQFEQKTGTTFTPRSKLQRQTEILN